MIHDNDVRTENAQTVCWDSGIEIHYSLKDSHFNFIDCCLLSAFNWSPINDWLVLIIMGRKHALTFHCIYISDAVICLVPDTAMSSREFTDQPSKRLSYKNML